MRVHLKKKDKKPRKERPDDGKDYDRALNTLGLMKFRDMQRACIARGLEPEIAVKSTIPELSTYYLNNYQKSENPYLLTVFDAYVEEALKKRGYKDGDVLLSPAFRFGITTDLNELGPIKDPTAKKVKIEPGEDSKAVREKDDETGVVKGTKKNLTYKMAIEGKGLEEIMSVVKKSFPGAQEKSIKIWYKRAIKKMKNED